MKGSWKSHKSSSMGVTTTQGHTLKLGNGYKWCRCYGQESIKSLAILKVLLNRRSKKKFLFRLTKSALFPKIDTFNQEFCSTSTSGWPCQASLPVSRTSQNYTLNVKSYYISSSGETRPKSIMFKLKFFIKSRLLYWSYIKTHYLHCPRGYSSHHLFHLFHFKYINECKRANINLCVKTKIYLHVFSMRSIRNKETNIKEPDWCVYVLLMQFTIVNWRIEVKLKCIKSVRDWVSTRS